MELKKKNSQIDPRKKTTEELKPNQEKTLKRLKDKNIKLLKSSAERTEEDATFILDNEGSIVSEIIFSEYSFSAFRNLEC